MQTRVLTEVTATLSLRDRASISHLPIGVGQGLLEARYYSLLTHTSRARAPLGSTSRAAVLIQWFAQHVMALKFTRPQLRLN